MTKTGDQVEKAPPLEQQMKTLLEHIKKEPVPTEMRHLAEALQAALKRRTEGD